MPTVTPRDRVIEAVKIILLAILASIVYGILHDQVTARVCVEYFTIGHPPVFETDSPTLLGLGWGVLATWWVGLSLGLALALSARAGKRPTLGVADVIRPVIFLMACAGTAAAVTGVTGYLLGRANAISLEAPYSALVPAESHAGFLADRFAHTSSYSVGFIGGLVVCAWVVRRRGQLSGQPTWWHHGHGGRCPGESETT